MAVLRSTRARCALLCLIFAAFSGCGGTPNPRDLSAEDRAKLVKKLRDEAEYQFGEYQRTAGDPAGTNEKALFAYRDAWRQITELMGPSDFPLAYANYGGALSRVGLHYKTLAQAIAESLKSAPPGEQAALRSDLKRVTAEAMKSFQLSNRQFEIYFQSPQGSLDPKAYSWAIGNSENLGDWRGALKYLELLEASGGLSEQGRQQVATLRKEYSENLRRQEEQELERELKGGASGEPRVNSPEEIEPAN